MWPKLAHGWDHGWSHGWGSTKADRVQIKKPKKGNDGSPLLMNSSLRMNSQIEKRELEKSLEVIPF